MGNFEAFSQSLLDDIEYNLAVSKGQKNKVFALQRLQSRFRKKFALGSPSLATKAIDDFKLINSLVSTKKVVTDPFIIFNARQFIEVAFERFNARNSEEELIQIPFDISHIADKWRFGPGASNGVKGTHAAQKLVQPMSCTVAAESLVRSLRLTNLYMRSFDAKHNRPVTLVGGSRLETVPKNELTDRTIAIEPSGNMALQLAAGVYIEDVLRFVGLDIRSQQDRNKLLACQGSISGDLVTIDMKSASDMILIDLCLKLLPRQLSLFLLRIRSSETELPGGERVKLNMMSTMGNGFTFPLMTLIFTALLYAVRLSRGGPSLYIDWKDCGIFGDDIVCTADEAFDLVKAIEDSGFEINKLKSYFEGPFRESCGGDFVDGYNCTPFYVKALKDPSDIYVAINQVFDYCGYHGFIFDRTLLTLRRMIQGPLHFVPEWHADTDGVRVQQVQRRYKHLSVRTRRFKFTNEHFAMMLICGGYITAGGPNLLYVPRPFKTRYKVRKSRLPNGYLDGRDVETRCDLVSDFVESWSFLLRD